MAWSDALLARAVVCVDPLPLVPAPPPPQNDLYWMSEQPNPKLYYWNRQGTYTQLASTAQLGLSTQANVASGAYWANSFWYMIYDNVARSQITLYAVRLAYTAAGVPSLIRTDSFTLVFKTPGGTATTVVTGFGDFVISPDGVLYASSTDGERERERERENQGSQIQLLGLVFDVPCLPLSPQARFGLPTLPASPPAPPPPPPCSSREAAQTLPGAGNSASRATIARCTGRSTRRFPRWDCNRASSRRSTRRLDCTPSYPASA